MSDAVAELSQGLRLSDPKPDRCASCFGGADATTRFVDFDSAIDRGSFVDPESMAVLDSIDSLHLCESCVRNAAEIVGFKPELHSRQLREIRKQEVTNDYWQDRAHRAEKRLAELEDFVASRLGESVPAKRGRRAA